MKPNEISAKGTLEMIREIREKRYEETKNMTREERSEYSKKQLEAYEELRKQINLDDYDFPFLHKK